MPSNLSILKSKVNNLDIGKSKSTPADLSKLSIVVKNDVVEKTDFDEFVKNVYAIQTTANRDLV